MPVYVWENVDMLPSLSYTSTVFMSLVCVHSVRALRMGDTCLYGLHFLQVNPQLQDNATTHMEEEEQQQRWQQQQQKIPMSTVQRKINVTSPPEDIVCLLGNFVKVIAAQAERLVVGLGCMWESSQQTAHLRWAPRAHSGVRRVIFAFHQISLSLSPFFHSSSSSPLFHLFLSFSISL